VNLLTNQLRRGKQSGVTLVELMVVIVIFGILMSVAVPSYRDYMIRANRTDAKAALLTLAAAQEKHYLQNNTYSTKLDDLGVSAKSEYGHYTIAIASADATDFVATATPLDGQAQDTDCALLAVDSLGRTFGGKSPINKANNNTKCWGTYD